MQTNGIKQTEGKTSYSEIDWSFIEKMAKCMNLNKGKYPPKNWQKPMNPNLLLDAAQRHLIELQKDNLLDKENGVEHAVAVALNMMMYSYQQNKTDLSSKIESIRLGDCKAVSSSDTSSTHFVEKMNADEICKSEIAKLKKEYLDLENKYFEKSRYLGNENNNLRCENNTLLNENEELKKKFLEIQNQLISEKEKNFQLVQENATLKAAKDNSLHNVLPKSFPYPTIRYMF